MSELWLVAHKVRGEPAFDIATRMECPECHGQCGGEYVECPECDSLGYWWIIPTSGHRAYPWWYCPMIITNDYVVVENIPWLTPMPPDLPDHYTTRAAPTISLDKLIPQRPCNMTRRV